MTGLTASHLGLDVATWPTTADGCRLDDLRAVVEHPTGIASPTASERAGDIPVYDAARLRSAVGSGGVRERAVRCELAENLLRGPGIVVIREAIETAAVDRVSDAFRAIIELERETGVGGGDHYARPGANDRVWNALEKLAVADPDAFIDYYRSDMIALAAEAWLGPDYQMSSQVNVVNPGGEAQRPHRDYHLGFMTEEEAANYPAHAHLLSPVLTLQGAVAHGDMGVESGPTKLLPHSQRYGPGYLAWRRPEFIDYFEANCVQLPLASGDAVFFNPAVFHAAGTNRTADVRRMANLLQISSSMGRAMERIDRRRMSLCLYPALQARLAAGLGRADADRVVAASAEGYPFPADLDVDKPVNGLRPPSQADRVRTALTEGWSPERLAEDLPPGPAG
jgi:ectoine hydroxylase-related dioxygenase (phytanoyl-CoA dioxygenase family)